MFLTDVDQGRNLLLIRFSGRVGPDEAKQCAAQIEESLKKLQPGFQVLTDLSGLERMDLSCEPYLDRVMDACNRHGVARVVRVVPDAAKDIGFGIMSLFHYGRDVRTQTCQNLAEAEQALAASAH